MNKLYARAARISVLLGCLGGCASGGISQEQFDQLAKRQEVILRRMEVDREASGAGYAENERLRRELAFEKEQRNLSEASRSAYRASDAFRNMMSLGR